jgi:hypothetical protein
MFDRTAAFVSILWQSYKIRREAQRLARAQKATSSQKKNSPTLAPASGARKDGTRYKHRNTIGYHGPSKSCHRPNP